MRSNAPSHPLSALLPIVLHPILARVVLSLSAPPWLPLTHSFINNPSADSTFTLPPPLHPPSPSHRRARCCCPARPCPARPALPCPAVPRDSARRLRIVSVRPALCSELTLVHARLVPLETSHSLCCSLLNISPPLTRLALIPLPPTTLVDTHHTPKITPPASCSLSILTHTSAVAAPCDNPRSLPVQPTTQALLPLVPEPARLKFQQRPASAPPFHHK
jgi:hypothetical protein